MVVPDDVLAERKRDKVIQNDSGDNEAKNKGEIIKNAENHNLPSLIPPTTQNDPINPNPTAPSQPPKQIHTPDMLLELELNTSSGF